MLDLPYLTSESPGIGGQIKECPEDFRVDEVPLYSPCGEGTHLYFRLTKAGIPTPAAIARIARYMNVNPADIGFAGLKDAQALTTQIMSLEHADERRLASLSDPAMTIEILGRHGNKLRTGHLAGNRFSIRVRGLDPAAAIEPARRILAVIERRGVPNYFGLQRFGARGDTGELGEMLVKGDLDEFIARYLGRPRKTDPEDCRAARDAFDGGFFARALERWPRHYADERRALAAYKKRQHAGPAVAAIDKRMKRLYVSAFQSAIFNDVLARRLETLDKVFVGDMAQKVDSGGVFRVEDAAVEQPRAERFEISPTGPIPGYRSDLAGGEPGQIELAALSKFGVTTESFRGASAIGAKGARRALRFNPGIASLTPGSDARGEFLELSFHAPSGCYATALLRELMKTP
ncbi:MAG: tRNA pseudouridine(13) synthase TruD [Planctomycetota bacterium]|nr:tRNA pseudouridine(13) synthase TruD [Planctomycetota bacterium]